MKSYPFMFFICSFAFFQFSFIFSIPIFASQTNCYEISTKLCEISDLSDMFSTNNSWQELYATYQNKKNDLPYLEKTRLLTGIVIKKASEINKTRPLTKYEKRQIEILSLATETIRSAKETFPYTNLFEHINWKFEERLIELISASTNSTFLTILTQKDTKNTAIEKYFWIFNDEFSISEQEYNLLYSINEKGYLSTIEKSDFLNFLSLLKFNKTDIPETKKLKYFALETLSEKLNELNSNATNNYNACQIIRSISENEIGFMYWLQIDMSPELFENYIGNLQCIENFNNKVRSTAKIWEDYIKFVKNNKTILENYNENDLLTHFKVPYTKKGEYNVYGSLLEPLININQFFIIIALQTKQKTGNYFFSPLTGNNYFTKIISDTNYVTFDYVIYNKKPLSGEWKPNMYDYKVENPNSGDYVDYLIAHKIQMDNELYNSRYNLPTTHFNYRNFFITTFEFLNVLKQDYQNRDLITGFADYPVPDLSKFEDHPWKVQTTGPAIPGAKAMLIASGNWRGSCTNNDFSNPYKYTVNGLTYCLDMGDNHEKGHLALGMDDTYRSDSTEFFFNTGNNQEKCLLLKTFREKSQSFLATYFYGKSLVFLTSIKDFLPTEWESMHYNTHNQFSNKLRYNINNRYKFYFELDDQNLKINSINWYSVDSNNYSIVQNDFTNILDNGGNIIGISSSILDTTIMGEKSGLFSFIFINLDNGSSEGFVLPSPILSNIFNQTTRLEGNNSDPRLKIKLYTKHKVVSTL